MQKIKAIFIRFLVVLLALQGVVAAELINIMMAAAAEIPEVVINELMWMGTYSGGANHTADEWIELRNTSDSAVDISGWKLTNSGSSGDLTIASGTIPANGYYLIANNDEESLSSILNVAPDLVTTTIVLSNSCVSIDLIRADATTADSMGCSDDNYFAGLNDTADKRALERNYDITDGAVATSWHTSTLFANLDAGALGFDLASPRAANITDTTAPDDTSAVVNDGSGADVDWNADGSSATANWSGFDDPETGIDHYLFGVGRTQATADWVPFSNVGLVNQATVGFPSDVSAGTFCALVKAVNGVGLTSDIVASDCYSVNMANPDTPANLTVTDTPADNGGSIQANWDASASLDVTNYQLNYRRLGDLSWTSIVVSSGLEKIVSGLENAPTTYEFTVEAIDFNSQHSAATAISTGQALDNLAPIIDSSKVVLTQNKPGNDDTIFGTAGTSNEPNIKAYVFNHDPSTIGDAPVEVLINASGAFNSALSIGDNKVSKVWVQLFDGTNTSVVDPTKQPFTNDIVGPASPALSKAVANCDSDNCRVTLDWQAGSTDTASYKVTYTVDGVDHQTFEVTTLTMALDLASGKTYQFKVVGYDQYGNPSAPSNAFSIALTKGVKTTVTGSGTITEAISGALEVSTTPVPESAPAQFVPKAKAAEPVVETPAAADKPLVSDSTSSHDWIRIFVVVILLLIIAGSFYALSRSVQETPEESFDKAAAKSKANVASATGKRRHRRSRRKRT